MKVLQSSKIMKELKQKIRNRRRQRERVTRSLEVVSQNSNKESSSTASVNDWQNWVVLRGSEETKAADIQNIGKAIGVFVTESTYNKFSVLSRPRTSGVGPVLMPVEDGGCTVGVEE
jgi:tRNA A37 methylthiotransferase MiaB